MFKGWKTVAVTGLALVGAYVLVQRYRSPGGLLGDKVKAPVESVAVQRFVLGAKAQAEAAKIAAAGSQKAAADAAASAAVVKS